MQNSEGSILSQYRSDFQGYGIDLRVTPDAVKAVAAKAHGEKTGARGLMTVLERVLRNYKFELPSTPIKAFEVKAGIVENPDAELGELLKNGETFRHEMMKDEIKTFADRFQAEQGIKLIFTKEAVDALVAAAIATDKTVKELCAERFRDLEYGLKLISRNTGKTSFNISEKFVENPGEELSRRIARSFRQDE
jgi:ATP-dependent protease Clp ATPase subunit